MKKLLLTTTEAYGKEIKNTISSSYDNSKIIINFTDDTFLVLEVTMAYDREAEIRAATELYYADFSIDKLIKNGIISIKEIDELYIKADKLRKENRRIQFESLKEEFEKEGNYESYNK